MARLILPLSERFWSKVNKTDSCWLWTGVTNGAGYGQVSILGTRVMRYAHRVAWELHHGPIPKRQGKDALFVCHHCDNPSCVNPAHLWLGTCAQNLADMKIKGRQGVRFVRRGVDLHNTRLTPEIVLSVRRDRRPTLQIARELGVSESCIWNVRKRNSWAYLPDESVPSQPSLLDASL